MRALHLLEELSLFVLPLAFLFFGAALRVLCGLLFALLLCLQSGCVGGENVIFCVRPLGCWLFALLKGNVCQGL